MKSSTKQRVQVPAPRRHAFPVAPRQRPAIPRPRTRPAIETDTRLDEVSRPAVRTPFVLLILLLVSAGIVGLVLLNTAINETAFRLHELSSEQKKLDMQEQKLERDVAELETAGALNAAAHRLGLVPAGPPAFIKLPSGEVVGKPTPAR